MTPNIPEAEILGRHRGSHRLADAREAARRIHAHAARARSSSRAATRPATSSSTCCSTASGFTEFPTPRIHTRNTHGTGCTFASAIAAHLALGHRSHDATARAQAYVAGAIRHGLAIGQGHGPLDHFWQTRTDS